MLPILLSAALAGPRIVAVGEPVIVDAGGRWPRLFPRADGGWDLTSSNQDGLILTHLTSAFVRSGPPAPLVADSSLIDHGWAICPDGTVLHVGMGTRDNPQHTATVRRFDADWQELSVQVAFADDPSAMIVDQAVVCGEIFRGFTYAHFYAQYEPETRFVPVDAEGGASAFVPIANFFLPVGISLMERDETLYAVCNDYTPSEFVRLVAMDAALGVTEDRLIQVVDPPAYVYWPQATLSIDGDTFVAYVTRDDRDGWVDQYGDVNVVQFDAEWNIVQTVQVLANGPADGGFQPGLAIQDDRLVVVFTAQDYTNRVVVVTLAYDDPVDTGGDTAGETGGDTDGDTAGETGGDDTAVPDDTDDTDAADPPPRKPGGCGCGSGASPGWWGLLGLAALRRRPGRRRERRG